MKTIEEIKKGLKCCRTTIDDGRRITCNAQCTYITEGVFCRNVLHGDTNSYIAQLELFVSQVSKALCGKKNATICEVLDAASQLKNRLAQVEREKDALMRDVKDVGCALCRYVTSPMEYIRNECFDCVANCNFEWRGVCAEKKEIQTDLQRDREKQLGYVELKDELLMEADGMSEFIKDMAKFVDKQILEKVERGEMHISLHAAAEEIHQNAVTHGWWESDRSGAEVRALIHSEWSEALEEARAGRPMEWHECLNCHMPCMQKGCGDWIDEKCLLDELAKKPEGIAVELIDGVIRILDWMGKEEYVFPDGFNAHVSGAKMLCKEFPEHKLDLSKIPAAEIVDWLHTETASESWAEGMGYEHCISIVFAWLDAQGVNPEAVLLRKHAYNVTRPYKHGKKF